VLLPRASNILDADARSAPLLRSDEIVTIVSEIPDSWLGDEPRFSSAAEHRAAYLAYLTRRLAEPRAFAEGAEHARLQHL